MMRVVAVVVVAAALASSGSVGSDAMTGCGAADGTAVARQSGDDVPTEVAGDEDDDILEEMLGYFIVGDDVFEGRKKKFKKKYMKYLAAAVLFKALLLPQFLALVKILTAKAYFISVLALILTASVITKKSDPPPQDTEQVINLLPKGRSSSGQVQAYRSWRTRRWASERKKSTGV